MLSKNKDWFYFDKYWGTWSRVLLRRGAEFPEEIAISLTPQNGWNETSKAIIGEGKVRTYITNTLRTNYHHEVPDHVYDDLVKHFGVTHANLLFHADILAMFHPRALTRTKHNAQAEEGTALRLLIKDPHLYPFLNPPKPEGCA